MKYFENLPLISYDGFPARNITSVAAISEATKKQRAVFYDYTLEDFMRPDTLSNLYYDSPDYTYLIYLANDVVDPYYDFNISDSSFEKFIENKYGSAEAARSRIIFWRSNWRSDTREISSAVYELLSAKKKSYYSPVLDVNLRVHSYKRKQKDLQCSSNKITLLNLSSPVIVEVGQVISGAEVIATSGDTITVKNLTTPITSVEGSTVVSSVDLAVSITAEEMEFWEPVDFYTYEYEKNEQKRNLRLIDNEYKTSIERELKRVLKSE